MTKQWKSNGPEQELLERMFDDGCIEEWETPAQVQSRDPIFKPFSERVFANHFRSTKLKMVYGTATGNSFDFLDYVKRILRLKIDFSPPKPTGQIECSRVGCCSSKFFPISVDRFEFESRTSTPNYA